MLRFGWLHVPTLDLNHPIAAREARRKQPPLPDIIQKLSNPWKMLSYAAMMDGVIFVITLINYNSMSRTFAPLAIFLTPIGMIVTLALLQTLVYWATLIGVSNAAIRSITGEIGNGTWRLLRMTPYSVSEIFLAKLNVAIRPWLKPLRTLIIIRALILAIVWVVLVVPSAHIASENLHPVALNFNGILAGLFLLEPVIDVALTAALGLLSGILFRNSMWAMLGSYGLNAIVYGGLSFASAFWLILATPLGTMATLFVPLNHWSTLLAAIMPTLFMNEMPLRAAFFTLTMLVIPLVVGFIAFRFAARTSKKIE